MAALYPLILAVLAAACGGREPRVAAGAVVKLRYSVEAGGKPAYETPGAVTARIGSGDLPPAVEARLMGRRAGERVSFTLSAADSAGFAAAPGSAGKDLAVKAALVEVRR